MPGWTATVTEAPLPKPVNVAGATITKAPRTVTWTAQPGTKIAPGEYQNFSFASDALPAAGEMVLPVDQYYSDGTVVHWTEPTVAGRPEPEHPAPVFNVTAASASEASASATPAADTQASSTSTPATTTSDNTARVLGGIALVLALVAGGVVLLRRRPKTDVKWSHSHLPANRWRLRCLAVLLAAVALLVGAAAAAQAHNVLVATSPADGSTVKVVPAAVMLTFNEPALAVGTEIIVTGPAGQVQTGAAALVNNTVSEHLSPGSPAGQYKVVWRVASADGHPVAGTFSFTATAASAGQRPTATTATNSATSTPASGSGRSLVLWVVAGGVVVLLLVVSFIRIRKPRTTPHEERDDNS
jgi:methionine-rich copper-binding protein CopC